MPKFRIQEPVTVARCSSCNAEVVWYVNPRTAKKMPLSWKTRVKDEEADAWYCDSHFQDCPQAQSWRKPR